MANFMGQQKAIFKLRTIPPWVIGVVFAWVIIIHAIFYFILQSQVRDRESVLTTLVRQDLEMVNYELMARTVNDLENIKLIRCSSIVLKSNPPQVVLNHSFKDGCSPWPLLLTGTNSKVEYKAINGSLFDISFVFRPDSIFYVAVYSLQFFGGLLIILLHGVQQRKLNFKLQTLEIENNKTMEVFNVTKQVAHDIRSPLAALDMALKDDASLPESKRLIVRTATNRIHEIANELLQKNKSTISKNEVDSKEDESVMQKILLSSVAESIVAEKRMQYRARQGILIQSNLSENSYGIFVSIHTREFRRIISNLINNSVEAFTGGIGNITVGIKRAEAEKMVCIEVTDNGKGMPSHIVAKLGERGVSFGKESSAGSGSGLGVFHAKSSVEKWGGKFAIESKENQGTTVKIYLPEAQLPISFVPKIKLSVGQKVVVLDDDQSIHQIWNGRFDSAKTHESNVEIVHFAAIADCEKWMERDRANLYLIDFEFLGNKESGFDFIVRKNLQKQTVLVTSRYEEPELQAKCESAGIGLVPKGLAAYVPIVIESPASTTSAKVAERLDAILIDDDLLVQMIWEAKAADKKLKVKIYSDPSEVDFSKIAHDCPIYIDSNLKDGVKGEGIAAKLHSEGFSRLYLATGYEKEHFAHLTFLKGVIGKEPPW
ncbi:MAG: hypothetical protein A2451_02025 [Bdellovibrionales bacterium RIFOXYC2_FULL_39_8]|nr:MAG: hypothetical protein A2385_13820 [Bdellovibrionales bacterium RIFOXYB1_FULL_39_21]OFZ72940.1 MAG: hypothetical protein A2451_02025 [Bdellovibrionales bacterium RIFOXYC2_FULL_39_8]